MNDLTANIASLSLGNEPPTATDIPTELWLHVLAHLDPRDLSAVALVSRVLQHPAQSLLFRSCVLKLVDPGRLRSILAFYTSPGIAPCVQECTVLGCRHNVPADVAHICNMLPHFTNLRHLVFQYVRMTSTTVAALTSKALSALPSLSLVCCMTDFPAPPDGKTAIFHPKKFLLHNYGIPAFPDDARWFQILRLEALQVLDLAQPYSTRFFVHELIKKPGILFPVLEVLRLNVDGLVSVNRFDRILPAFPALRILDFTPYHASQTDPPKHAPITLHGDALPLLSSFYGPVIHAAKYCAGRALLRHLSLYGDDRTGSCHAAQLLPALPALASVASGLTSLELRIAFPVEDLTPVLFSSFPELRSLRVTVPYYPWSPGLPNYPELTDILRVLALLALAPPAHLEVLYLAYRYGARGKPWAEVLAQCAQMPPAIRELAQRSSPALRRICVCCDLAFVTGDPDTFARTIRERTLLWRWTRGDETVAESRVAGAECIDGRKLNMEIRDPDFRAYTIGDALDEEWAEATSTHRRGG
ncbi:hypothetical protein MVEN_01616800 [Mycena venus]|uniref:F-box domain-containing protein n=1 Tax=Mycena venus TaxID=2733690 RepID=A0A8H6XSI2_9AGAR|nr:hypothetical protein MVEN_01616800 [Mycena venus]